MEPVTLGVEEEYLLLDPETWVPVSLAEQVRAAAGLAPIIGEGELHSELLQVQVEVATPVCTDLEEVGGHLLRMRHAVGAAAEANGCRLAACATPPLRGAVSALVTEKPRYRAMRVQAPQLVAEQLVNGMHVHVAVPSREIGVAVLNRIRGWLPVLVAMSANSPLWDGQDTGFASWRTVIYGRWPVSGPPPAFRDLYDHRERIETLLASGIISDTGQLYWQARLSDRFPTVEVRCPDVQLRADEAVMLAGIVRALVTVAIHEAQAGTPVITGPPEIVQAANWQAARHGLNGHLITATGERRSAGDVVALLMEHIAPALEAAGDSREVVALVHRLLQDGTPADRQRRALAEGGVKAVTEMVVAETTAP
ncbi:carboxylate-amine ligase [Streptomyces xantholiticus]|uniref:carboxylate-amine ligase n=1 Tax=Streptomyces xantholiticus TaxID=68285 RepID=UPI0016784284|nr:glutamate--cysteine ligase [Streptomyces xantholiticus]GGW71908.1 putative glutamate--cysteine ligase 2 [Streptomyces xantholiticus]